jgi:putative membrane protein insertion efficiency factor
MKHFVASFSRGINLALRGLVRLYQLVLSPLFALFDGMGGGCRYQPTCSQYCLEALAGHGTLRGLWLTLKRLGRCAPWGTWGYDPVPAPRERKPGAAETRERFRVPPAPPAGKAHTLENVSHGL